MKLLRRWSFWFSLLLLLIVLVFVLLSFGYSADARLVPLVVGIPTLALAILVLLGERYPRLTTLFDVSLEDLGKVGHAESAPTETHSTGKLLALLAWMFGLLILVFLAGYVIAIPIFTLLFLKISTRASWLKTIIITLIMGGIIYGGFEVWMRGNLFEGMFFEAILPPI